MPNSDAGLLADRIIRQLQEDAGEYGPYTVYVNSADTDRLSAALAERFEDGMVPYAVVGRDDLLGDGGIMITTDHPAHEQVYERENRKRNNVVARRTERFGPDAAQLTGGMCVGRSRSDEWIAANNPDAEVRAIFAELVQRKQAGLSRP